MHLRWDVRKEEKQEFWKKMDKVMAKFRDSEG